jgi:hypothetical protein
MNDKIADDIVSFWPGDRQEAIRQAIKIVKKNGRPAELTICRDILGHHTGGEDCFCDPRTIRINEKGEVLDE